MTNKDKNNAINPENICISRRNVLKAGLSTAACFSISGMILMPKKAKAGSIVTATVVAEKHTKSMVDGANLEIWRFNDVSAIEAGPGDLKFGITAIEGDDIQINLTNNLDNPITFNIPGYFEDGPTVNAGDSTDINFTAPPAGTYLMHDNNTDTDPELGLAMGLSAPLVTMPSNGMQELYAGGPSFDKQYVLVLQDSDDRLNTAMNLGQPYNLDQFLPNYYCVNGLSFPNTTANSETKLDMNVGEFIAIRIVNASLLTHPMHFHGYHVKVASRDRNIETRVVDKDSVLVSSGECVDLILPVNQAGIYPMHTHYIPGVTTNGVYVNPYGGALVIMSASE